MNTWRKHLVTSLIVGLLHLTLVDTTLLANQSGLPNPALTKQQVGQIGVGAKVKVELSSGKKLKGSIQSVEEGGFLLASHQAGSPTHVAYDQVSKLKLAKLTYNSKGQTNAAQAKRVTASLGVGHHIMVETAEGQEYHGNIVAIDAESFSMQPDHAAGPVRIAYNGVQQMGPNLSTGAKVAIIAGAAAGAFVIIFLIWLEHAD